MSSRESRTIRMGKLPGYSERTAGAPPRETTATDHTCGATELPGPPADTAEGHCHGWWPMAVTGITGITGPWEQQQPWNSGAEHGVLELTPKTWTHPHTWAGTPRDAATACRWKGTATTTSSSFKELGNLLLFPNVSRSRLTTPAKGNSCWEFLPGHSSPREGGRSPHLHMLSPC